MHRRQGSGGSGKDERERETMLINDLSRQMDLQTGRILKEGRLSSSPNGWHSSGRTSANGYTNDVLDSDGTGMEEQTTASTTNKQEDDFFAQYLGKSTFTFNATAELMKEMDQMHTSTGYVRGFEDSAIESERKSRPPSPTVAALLHGGGRNTLLKNYPREDDVSLRAQLEDTTRSLVREKGINVEREHELSTLRTQIVEERRTHKERVSDVERELASLRAQAQEARRSAQELEKQRDGWRAMVTERENALKAAQRQSAEARERIEQERESWKRSEDDKQKRFEDELSEARSQLQSEWERERLRWRAKEETKEKEIAMLTARTQEAAQDIMRERTDAEERAIALRSEVDLLHAQLEDRDAHIEELRARAGEFETVTTVYNTENETIMQQTRGLEQEIERGRKEIDRLRKEVREKDAALANLERQTANQTEDLERLHKEIQELQAEISSKSATESPSNKELDTLKERLRHQGEVMKRTEEMHRNQLGELQHQLQLLIEQYQAVDLDRSQQFEDLQDENAKLHADNTQLHAVNTEVLAAHAQVQADNKQLQSENSRLHLEHVKAHAESAKAQADCTKLQADNAKLQADTARLQSENARLQAENAKSQSEKTKLHADLTQLSQDSRDINAQADNAAAQIDERDRVIVSLRDQIDELTMDKTESEQAVDALRAHVAELARGKDTAIAAMQAQAARLGQEKEVLVRKLDDLRSQPIVEPTSVVRRSFSSSPVPPASPPSPQNLSRQARTPSPTPPTSSLAFPLPPHTPGRTAHFNPPPSARPLQPPPASHPPPPRPAFTTDPVLYIHQQLQNLHQQRAHSQSQYESEEQANSEHYEGYMNGIPQNYDPPHQPAPISRPSNPHVTPHKPPFNASLYPPVETAPSTSIPSLYNQTRSSQEDERYSNISHDQSQFIHPRPGSRNGPSYLPPSPPPHQDFHKFLPNHSNVQYPPSYNPLPSYPYDYNAYPNPHLENILHHVMNSRAHQPPPSFASHPQAPTTRNPHPNPPKPSRPPAKPANSANAAHAARPSSAPRTRAKAPATTRPSVPIITSHAHPPRTSAPSKARSSPRLWK